MSSLIFYSFLIFLYIFNNEIWANTNSFSSLIETKNNVTLIHKKEFAVGVGLDVGTSAIYISKKIKRFNNYLGLFGYVGAGLPLFPNLGLGLNISNLFKKKFKFSIYKHYMLLNLITEPDESNFSHNYTISISHQWKLKNDPVFISLGIQRFAMTINRERQKCNYDEVDGGCEWVPDIREFKANLPTFSLEYRF